MRILTPLPRILMNLSFLLAASSGAAPAPKAVRPDTGLAAASYSLSNSLADEVSIVFSQDSQQKGAQI